MQTVYRSIGFESALQQHPQQEMSVLCVCVCFGKVHNKLTTLSLWRVILFVWRSFHYHPAGVLIKDARGDIIKQI